MVGIVVVTGGAVLIARRASTWTVRGPLRKRVALKRIRDWFGMALRRKPSVDGEAGACDEARLRPS